MTRHWGRWAVAIRWTEWFVGVWWWPVAKDLTFGLTIGPVSVMWERNPR